MEMGTSNFSEDYSSAVRINRMSRPKPLHTFGVLIIGIAHRAYIISASLLHGPIGSITETLAKLASPLVYAMLYQLLAVLSYFDDQILALENLVETIFPPSANVFNKIDALVYILETLQVEYGNAATDHEEKEIMIDINCSHQSWETEEKLQISQQGICTDNDGYESIVKDCSTKGSTPLAAMPQGKERKGDTRKKETVSHDKVWHCSSGIPMHVDEKPMIEPQLKQKDVVKEDPILQLFAEAWYM